MGAKSPDEHRSKLKVSCAVAIGKLARSIWLGIFLGADAVFTFDRMLYSAKMNLEWCLFRSSGWMLEDIGGTRSRQVAI